MVGVVTGCYSSICIAGPLYVMWENRKLKLKTAVVERDALGGQVALTPIVENYPGFTQVGGKTLVDIMVNHALQYIQIYQGEEVLDIVPGEILEVTTTRRKFKAKTVLLATGASHRAPSASRASSNSPDAA